MSEPCVSVAFLFVCPHFRQTFESADFVVIENRGVITDAGGGKTLDATVRLTRPCPHCGGKHQYHATELPCPFTGK